MELTENQKMCKNIADALENVVAGRVCECDECGSEMVLPVSVGDKYRCPSCGAVHDVDELDTFTLYDYFSDVLDVVYSVASPHDTPRGIRVMVTCGGPNIYVDSMSGYVELYWWTETARWPLSRDVVNALDEWAAEMWGCM